MLIELKESSILEPTDEPGNLFGHSNLQVPSMTHECLNKVYIVKTVISTVLQLGNPNRNL